MNTVRIAKVKTGTRYPWVGITPRWVGRDLVTHVEGFMSLDHAIKWAETGTFSQLSLVYAEIETDRAFDVMTVEQARRLSEIYTEGETPEQTMTRLGKNLWPYIREGAGL